MSNHNDILFAAAVTGVTAGLLDGKDFSQISAATIALSGAQQAAIVAAATAIDLAIPADATLSVGSTGVLYVVPFAGSGTAATILPILTKPVVLQALVFAAFRGKGDLSSAVVATYAAEAAGIAAQYAEAVTEIPAS